MKTTYKLPWLALCAAAAFTFSSCDDEDFKDIFDPPAKDKTTLTQVAQTNLQWTGVAVSEQSRIFANFPRLSGDVPYSVVEVKENNELVPFPNQEWNQWNPALSPADHFVSVQAVYVDDENYLWIVDPASPMMQGVVDGGAKLVKVDLATNEIVQKIIFSEPVIYPKSYLNDVRIDTQRDVAYLTDSGMGAIVVVDLKTGESRRLLGNHYSTKSENIIIKPEGIVYRNPDGSLPSVHSDGIALTPQRDYIYYQALTGTTLYRIGTQWLLDESLTEAQREAKVEKVGKVGPHDGIIFGPDGRLYLTGVANNSVERLNGNRVEHVVSSEHLKWPDTFSVGPDGYIYVTTSQLHYQGNPPEPYKIFKFKPEL
ncbi:L-dopachrome tautomerase-related protein [Pontibacter rugosus]|uniref:L-dopachrome tautomerase-related protein n=1 Tax=Pontibacter rugosus TaxID=1745966 RepID=A0ABW3SR62_9BACT